MKLLYGKPVAQKILARLKSEISSRVKKPSLAVILVGSNKASQIYVNLKEKTAREIGMNFFRYDFETNVSQAEIFEQLEKLNADDNIDGIIVQLPLPSNLDSQQIINNIKLEKDVDGFHPDNAELFLRGAKGISPVFPRAILQLIESSGEDLNRKKAVILANSNEFGQIMSTMLERQNLSSQYILAENIPSQMEIIMDSDVVVSAVGSPELLKGKMFKNGAIVIDGGIEKVGEKILGDVDFASVEALDGFITPVPGGVGPVTIACLLENTFLAFEAQQKEK